jgi:hypothetical protein
MLGDGWIDEGLSDRLEPGKRSFFVDPHQAAISSDIRRQNSCQPSFHPFAGQNKPLKS